MSSYTLCYLCCDSREARALARAAVSGDQKALDMFSWKTKQDNKLPGSMGDGLSCYVGGSDGKILTGSYDCTEIQSGN